MILIPALLSLSCALWFWVRSAGRDDPHASWTVSAIKTGAVAFLVPLACIQGAPGLIVAGLVLGALGDLALSRPGVRWFWAGMGAFGLGHAAYALAFADMPQGTWVWGLMLAVLVLVASTEFWLAPHTGPLRMPVRIYGVIIGAMAIAALSMSDRPVVVIGAFLFLVSDVILALRLFVLQRHHLLAGRLLWPLYYLGQVFIMLGMAAR